MALNYSNTKLNTAQNSFSTIVCTQYFTVDMNSEEFKTKHKYDWNASLIFVDNTWEDF